MAFLKRFFFALIASTFALAAQAEPERWKSEWPDTDFSKTSVQFSEIFSGGPPKDGIPSIDDPVFVQMDQVAGLDDKEGVISLEIEGQVRAYPIRILMWHEIVNDTLGGVPVSVTYCPLCNAALVFDRRLKDGRVLDFGTTGKLRNSDLVMYDRQTETWWQQFSGEAIIGDLQGTLLDLMPSRLESWASFKKRYDSAEVLIPNDPTLRAYGRNPYAGYSKSSSPFLFAGNLPKDIAPMAHVLVIGDEAWSLDYIKDTGEFTTANGATVNWQSGLSDALDGRTVFQGEDLGNISVIKDGADVAHHLTFAFAYYAFHPEGKIIQ